MRGKWLLASGTVVLMAVALGALSLLHRDRAPEARTAAAPPPPNPAFTAPEVSLRGSIRAQQAVAVEVPVEGTINSFFADVGDEVYEGQLLARITSTGLEAEHEAAASVLERARSRANSLESKLIATRLEASQRRVDASRARSEYERLEKAFLRQQFLFREGAAPRLNLEKAEKEFNLAKTEFLNLDAVARGTEDRLARETKELDAARAELTDQNAQYEQTGEQLAAGQIYSPVDGLIVSRRGAAGEAVTRDIKDLFVIALNLSLLEVVVEPEPPYLARIAPSQDAIVRIAEVPGRGIPGKVKEVKNNQVIVEFISPSPAVRPGLSAQVVIKLT